MGEPSYVRTPKEIIMPSPSPYCEELVNDQEIHDGDMLVKPGH